MSNDTFNPEVGERFEGSDTFQADDLTAGSSEESSRSLDAIYDKARVARDKLNSLLGELGTKAGGAATELEFSEEDFIQDEDAHVVLTKDGWIKRMREVKDPKSTRLREGDEVVGMVAFERDSEESLVTVCERGYGKRTKLSEFAAKNRGGVGMISVKCSSRNGLVTGVRLANEEDHLFGSVTNSDIADAMEKVGKSVDKRKILLDDHIKELGKYDVPVKFHGGVTATVKVWVVRP